MMKFILKTLVFVFLISCTNTTKKEIGENNLDVDLQLRYASNQAKKALKLIEKKGDIPFITNEVTYTRNLH